MNNIRIAIALLAVLSATQAYGYKWTVYNLTKEQLTIELPLQADLRDPQKLTIASGGNAVYEPDGWYVGYCLFLGKSKITKPNGTTIDPKTELLAGGPWDRQPVRNKMTDEAKKNGTVNLERVPLNNASQIEGYCGGFDIFIVTDTTGTIHVIGMGKPS